MSFATVLLVSQDDALVRSVQTTVGNVDRLQLRTFASAAEAHSLLHDTHLTLVLVQVADAGDAAGAAEILQAIAAAKRPVGLVAIGEPGRAEHGLALLRKGAADYLERPLDLQRLAYLLDTLTVRARRQLAEAPKRVASTAAVETDGPAGDFIYCPATPMGQLMDEVRRVAPVDSNLLLQGETGTGKTRLARLIHEMSSRRDQPFLVINCAALAAHLTESELFGHVKGAFTGADRERIGKFAAVGRGTLFLDEIDALSVELQAKLLRAVDDRVFEPVGSNKLVPLQARLVAASNQDLDEAVAAGRFRSDLFFRLNVVSFCLPALRDQPEVVPPMVERFLREFADRAGRNIPGVSSAALAALLAYEWPGNVRELRNVIERAVALRPAGHIDVDDLPVAIRTGAGSAIPAVAQGGKALARTKESAEAAHIAAALQRNKNNRLRAAAELGISRMTLYKKLHRYGLISASAQ
jgi:DNA-binding NtrC family response regulator